MQTFLKFEWSWFISARFFSSHHFLRKSVLFCCCTQRLNLQLSSLEQTTKTAGVGEAELFNFSKKNVWSSKGLQ